MLNKDVFNGHNKQVDASVMQSLFVYNCFFTPCIYPALKVWINTRGKNKTFIKQLYINKICITEASTCLLCPLKTS